MDASKFLALAQPKRERISVMGESLLVRELTVGERSLVLSCANSEPAKLSALLMRLCVLLDDGEQMFSEADMLALAQTSPAVADEVSRAIMRLSGMAAEGVEEKKA